MGACAAKPEAQQTVIGATTASNPKKAANSAAAADKKTAAFVEKIFSDTGTVVELNAGEKLIEQGVESEKMYLIKSGHLDLVLSGDDGTSMELARRGPGDMLGELSMLLGHVTAASAVAVGKVTVIEINQSSLLEQLKENPMAAGMLFRAVATYLSDRIAELSSKMRNNVVKAQAPAKQSHSLSATDIKKTRALFGLPDSAKLINVYQCSVRREQHGVKDTNAHFGELYIFDDTLCFDLKMFAFHKQMTLEIGDIVSLLKSGEDENSVEVQSKGQSVELHIPEGFHEACTLMEAARVRAKAAMLEKESSTPGLGAHHPTEGSEGTKVSLDDFHHMVEPIVKSTNEKKDERMVDLGVKEEDWKHFLSVATQHTYQKGEYVLQEGQATAKLFQVVRGSLRVELQLAGQGQAVVVGYRKAGEMLGETSLLKEGKATASLAADEPTSIICIEGRALEKLFETHPELPSRFFCFLASYQANRLSLLTASFADSKSEAKVTVPLSLRISLDDVFADAAYASVMRKYLATEEEAGAADAQIKTLAFDFYIGALDYKSLPDQEKLAKESQVLAATYLDKRASATTKLEFLDSAVVEKIIADVAKIQAGSIKLNDARVCFKAAAAATLAFLEKECFEAFLGSSHYRYILELKTKEKIVPSLDDFKVLRVLGEGGFGQVIDVVKRDCGCHYAMKVMQKEMMKQNLGSSWRKKIASEQQIMTALHHPFMVNLKYSFQNSEFLILVMDLIASGDLSEFVLTKRRLTAEQTRWATMEVVEVMSYMHAKSILYRDLKPENLLIDDEGHIRLIDMGLAARVSEKNPGRNSRVGTDCYMAPEVRWARRRRAPYGKSADWYTVGVLNYEFTHGALPMSNRDAEQPTYRGGTFPTKVGQDFCERLLEQDYKKRLGCGEKGDAEIKAHPYFEGVDWDIVAACKIPSPMKGVKGVPKKKKDKEVQAQRTAGEIAAADQAEVAEQHYDEYNIDSWNFVSPTAVSEEYMESVYTAVSAI